MIDLGIVKPGSTIRVPFSSFNKTDGSSITMTNFAAADILIYKNGNTTERASTAGFTATTDFDGKTGKQLAIIDLADNTTADFYNAGAEYLIAIDAVTVDSVTTGGWIARFAIGYIDADINTTIATLSSQTSFTLTSGPAEDNALLGCIVLIHDIASAVQLSYAVISAYTGSTKTVTLTTGATFTASAGDNISIFGPSNARWFNALLTVALPLVPTTAGRTLDVSATGEAGVDWANVGSPTTALALTGTTIATTQKVDVETIKTNPVVNGGTVTFPTNATLASTTNITGGTISTVTNLTNLPTIPANWLTAAGTAADFGAEIATAIWTDTTAGDFTAALSIGKTIVNGVSLGTGLTINAYTGNTVQTGDSYARLGAPAGASISADIATKATPAQILTTALTEAYAADGAAGTLSQLLFGMQAFLQERAVAGTTVTVKKLDGSTTAMTFTLNDGTTPTSITRAT